jgi:hypothetical protein
VRRANRHADGDQRGQQHAQDHDSHACSPGRAGRRDRRRPLGPVVVRGSVVGEERVLVDQLVELLAGRPPQHRGASMSRISTI